MVAFKSNMPCSNLALQIFHGGFRRQDAVLANQAYDLGPKGYEGDEIDNCERAKKKPTNKKMLGRFDIFSPEPASERGEKGAMRCNEVVDSFRCSSENGRMGIPIEEKLLARIVRQRVKSRLSAGINRAIRFN